MYFKSGRYTPIPRTPQNRAPRNSDPMELHGDDGAQLPRLGDRVVDGKGFRATVRYVGPVCTAKDPTSIWIGETKRSEADGRQQR